MTTNICGSSSVIQVTFSIHMFMAFSGHEIQKQFKPSIVLPHWNFFIKQLNLTLIVVINIIKSHLPKCNTDSDYLTAWINLQCITETPYKRMYCLRIKWNLRHISTKGRNPSIYRCQTNCLNISLKDKKKLIITCSIFTKCLLFLYTTVR